jgi:hypothetical protein
MAEIVVPGEKSNLHRQPGACCAVSEGQGGMWKVLEMNGALRMLGGAG